MSAKKMAPEPRSTLHDHPGFAAAAATYDRLFSRKAEIDAAIKAKLRGNAGPAPLDVASYTEALMAGETPKHSAPPVRDHAAELDSLRAEQKTCDNALREARIEVERQHRRALVFLGESVASEYRAIVDEAGPVVEKLAELANAEADLRAWGAREGRTGVRDVWLDHYPEMFNRGLPPLMGLPRAALSAWLRRLADEYEQAA